MKQLHKWLALPGAAAVLCLQLALGAAAAEPPMFRDVLRYLNQELLYKPPQLHLDLRVEQ